MSENNQPVFWQSVESSQETTELIGRLFDVALPDAIFSDPLTKGDYTVILASETTVSMGAGFGGGGGIDTDGEQGSGGGGGGGGYAANRPVAMIEIGPNGVRVEPIIDASKIVVTFIASLIAIFAALGKARRG